MYRYIHLHACIYSYIHGQEIGQSVKQAVMTLALPSATLPVGGNQFMYALQYTYVLHTQ